MPSIRVKTAAYFNAIGPVALGTAVTLAIAAPRGVPVRRILDSASAVALAGVLAATIMVTVPINKELEAQPATDYPSDRSQSLVKNWSSRARRPHDPRHRRIRLRRGRVEPRPVTRSDPSRAPRAAARRRLPSAPLRALS